MEIVRGTVICTAAFWILLCSYLRGKNKGKMTYFPIALVCRKIGRAWLNRTSPANRICPAPLFFVPPVVSTSQEYQIWRLVALDLSLSMEAQIFFFCWWRVTNCAWSFLVGFLAHTVRSSHKPGPFTHGCVFFHFPLNRLVDSRMWLVGITVTRGMAAGCPALTATLKWPTSSTRSLSWQSWWAARARAVRSAALHYEDSVG